MTYHPAASSADPRAARRLAAVSPADLEDVLMLRRVLEVGSAPPAAAAQPPPALAQLAARLTASAEAELDAYRQADSMFHLEVARLAAPGRCSPRSPKRARINDLLDGIPLLAPNLAHSTRQHAALVDAISSGDEARAGAVMAEHMDGSAALLRGFLG